MCVCVPACMSACVCVCVCARARVRTCILKYSRMPTNESIMTESDNSVCIVLYAIAAVIVDLISAGMAYDLQTYTSVV